MASAQSPPPVHRPPASPTLRRWRLGAGAPRALDPNGANATSLSPSTAGPGPAIARCDLPRLPEALLARTGLLERLEQWAPVTVLQAMTGTGKTTLVTMWLGRQPPADVLTIWLDANPSVSSDFDRELGLALDRAGITSEHTAAAGPDGAARTRLHEWLLDAADPRRVVLVLDGVEELLDPTGVSGLIALVTRHRRFHLVICGAATNPFDSLAAASVAVNTITNRDLMLSCDELAELARLLGRSLDATMLARLDQATGGWIAAVRLLLAAMTDDQQELPHTAVTAYVERALIRSAPAGGSDTGAAGSQHELARLALADHLDDALITDIYGTDRAATVLAALNRCGLAERRHRGDVVIYEYPAVIRAVLSADFVRRDPVAARTFHAQLAAWYVHQDRREYDRPALRHAVAAGEWALATQIWDRRGLGLVAVDPVGLRAIVADIPADIVDEHPALRAYLSAGAGVAGSAIARQAMPLADLLYLSAAKLAALRSAPDGSGRTDAPEVVVGAETETSALIDRVRMEVATSRDAAVLGERVAWFELQVAATAMGAGSRDEALRQYQQAIQRAGNASADFVVAPAAAGLALGQAMHGETAGATRWLQRHRETLDAGRCAPGDGAGPAGIARALLALDRLDQPAAMAAIAGVGDVDADEDLWPYLAFLNCQYALHYGEPTTMLTRLASSMRSHTAGREPLPVPVLHLLARARADLLISLGQGQRAQGVLGSVPDPGPLLSVPAARLWLLSGDYEQARLRATRGVFDEDTGPRDQLELRLIHACAALRAGDRDSARELFREAVADSNEHGIVRGFAAIAPAELSELSELTGLSALNSVALSAGRSPVYADRLVLISLTKSERELIEALERTGSRREIAETRYVSLNTVKTQLRSLYQKLGTSSREDTLAKIRELGLLA